MSQLILIAAAAENNVIGNKNKLPWHLPKDLKHFKSITSGHTILMGRKTFESIGKPLPNRKNIILTNNTSFTAEGCTVIHSESEIPMDEKIFVIGGAQIYKAFIHSCKEIYLTRVHVSLEGDTFFPEFEPDQWKLVSSEYIEPDEYNAYAMTFEHYVHNSR